MEGYPLLLPFYGIGAVFGCTCFYGGCRIILRNFVQLWGNEKNILLVVKI